MVKITPYLALRADRISMLTALLIVTVICLAYANGANDNFKGVATLFGSGTTNYRWALILATVATLCGSIAACFFADSVMKAFRGKGLVDESLVTNMHFVTAVGLAAGCTVLLATRIGMPISTTHSLVGALVGAGVGAGSGVNIAVLAGTFFLPLLVSPFVAIALAWLMYPFFRWLRRRGGISEQTCFCVGSETVEAVPVLSHTAALLRVEQLTARIGDTVTCHRRYTGKVFGITVATLVDWLHYSSAGLVSFARGLHDTGKIAALLIVAPAFGKLGAIAVVGVCIAVGGLISARRVAITLGHKITQMTHGQGFTANLITTCVVLGAHGTGHAVGTSLPVSTTHVSCGSLFGIGASTRQGHVKMIARIIAAWVVTLPIAAIFGVAIFWLLGHLN